jgi:hypothetical protein
LAAIAKRADEKNDPTLYGCWQVHGGEQGVYDIVLPSESFSEAASREPAPALIHRLFGDQDGPRIMEQTSGAIESAESMILRDRPELSYPSDHDPSHMIAAVVTQLEMRPGHREACEELVRKVAEAIPKTDDIRRFTAMQPLIGDMRRLYAVRSIFDWKELDTATPIEQLLNQAFGIAEGGLVFRAAGEGLESLTSELLVRRQDLSRTIP